MVWFSLILQWKNKIKKKFVFESALVLLTTAMTPPAPKMVYEIFHNPCPSLLLLSYLLNLQWPSGMHALPHLSSQSLYVIYCCVSWKWFNLVNLLYIQQSVYVALLWASFFLTFYFILESSWLMEFLGSSAGKELTCQCGRCKRWRFNPWVRMIPWRRKWQPTLLFLPGKFHRQRSLAGYSPWQATAHDCKESDTASAHGIHTQTHTQLINNALLVSGV